MSVRKGLCIWVQEKTRRGEFGSISGFITERKICSNPIFLNGLCEEHLSKESLIAALKEVPQEKEFCSEDLYKKKVEDDLVTRLTKKLLEE